MKRRHETALLALAFLVGCGGTTNNGGALPPSNMLNGTEGLNARVVVAGAAATRPGERNLGAAPSTRRLDLAVVLRYRNEEELTQFVQAVTTKTSSSYHHWLSNDQFNTRFAPKRADYERVITSLKRAGLRISRTYANRTVIDVNASVAQSEQYFATRIDEVTQSDKSSSTVNIKSAYAPRGLGDVMLDVEGLDSRILVHPLYKRTTPHPHSGVAQRGSARSRLYGPISTASGYFGYGPLAFSTSYDLPIIHSTSGGGRFDGKGRAAGVVMDADFLDSDIASFLEYFDISQTGPRIKRVLIKGGPVVHGALAPDSVETTLDVQTILSNAPGVALTVYETPKLTTNYIADAYNQAVSDDDVDALNSSFGGCDVYAPFAAKTWSEIAKQGIAKGIAFVASSGDSGGNLCASMPASSPYFVALGGTSLQIGPGGAWSSETGWSGSGGGVSLVFGTPAWQAGIAGIDTHGRNVPDIALDANPFTGAAIYFAGSWNTLDNPIGGTSLASPLYVAALTEIDQVRNERVGGTAQSLFGIFKSSAYGPTSAPYFHDIVYGSNGPYFAAPGYDLVTGIGSISAWNLAGVL